LLLKNYLVILAGSPRGGEATWNSLHKYVLDHLDADLAICCSDKWNQDSSLFNRATYKWVFPELNNYFDYYDSNYNGNWKNYFETGKETGLYSSGSVHFVFKDMILRNYIDELKKYKYIIYTRFDQRYTDYHPEGIQDKILIPKGEDYFGICDRHALIPSDYSESFLSICEYINKPESLNNVESFNNCETTYMNHLKEMGLFEKVIRVNRSQFTASLKGEHTHWRVATYPLYFYKNLMLKYPDEFYDAINNLIKKRGLLFLIFNEFRLILNYKYLEYRKKLGKLKKRL
jgi:hypothetical protein